MDLVGTIRRALEGRYAIERELGAGGMATVYLAEELRHHRQVALKVLRPELAATLGAERFLREIQTTAQLTHPHILPLLDSGSADGTLFYVMPYVEGESLRDRLTRERQLPLEDAVQIAREVADALSYAHSHGVIHRDIKPENILLESGHAVVADFGIARAVSAAGGERLTETGLAVGTPAYMSPEQAAGSGTLDGRSDIYSLGCVLYEMLSGDTPYLGSTPQAILAKKLSEPLPRISVVRETVPPALEAVLAKALARTPADRWPTAAEFAAALEKPGVQVYGRTGGRRPFAIGRLPRWARRTSAVVAVVVVAAAGVVGSRFFLHRPLTITVSDVTPVTNDPGVEFEPAISPDGQSVAYVGGSLDQPRLFVRSTANVAGAAAVRLGDSLPGSEWIPSWTADGERVRFLTCRGALDEGCSYADVARMGGEVQALPVAAAAASCTYCSSPTWSPDGTRQVFTRGDTIFVSALADSVPRPIAVDTNWALGMPPHSFAWSPDGKRIAYVWKNLPARFGYNVDWSSIWVVSAEGGKPWMVAGQGVFNVSPVWLDDSHLLFVSDRGGSRAVWVIGVSARGPRGEPKPVPGIADPHSISYSIGSRRLAFSKFTVQQNIWEYPLDRRSPLSIRAGRPVTTGTHLIEEHDVSPDGRWIAYDDGFRGGMDLYKTPVAGGAAVSLATFGGGMAFAPHWSPDGRQIAFWGGNHNGISVLPAEGGVPTALWDATDPGSINSEPVWSPDGLAIAFHSTQAGRPQVWILTRDSVGGAWHQARLLADSAGRGVVWAPDGSGVVVRGRPWRFVSREGRVLWRRDLTAAHGLRLTGFAFAGSRDGRTIYSAGVHRDGRRGVWAIPVAGGTPRLVVAFDDPTLAGLDGSLSVGPDRLYLTVADYQSDIYVARLNY